jgi:hypothetical protein
MTPAYEIIWRAWYRPWAGTLFLAWKACRMRGITPRLSELKRALRWLREQYQRRAEEAAAGRDRAIERIRKSRVRESPGKDNSDR